MAVGTVVISRQPQHPCGDRYSSLVELSYSHNLNQIVACWLAGCRYSKALELDPLLGASAVGLARTYFVLQQRDKAEEILRHIIDAAPLNVNPTQNATMLAAHIYAVDGSGYTTYIMILIIIMDWCCAVLCCYAMGCVQR